MRTFLRTICIFLPMVLGAANKPVYVFITDSDIRQFEQVVQGFSESYPHAEIKRINLAGKPDQAAVRKFIAQHKPAMIIALGSIAATTAASVDGKTPVIFGMVLNHRRYAQLKKANIAGVSMEIPAQAWLTQFRLLYPELKAIAVPYNPDASAEIVRDAREAAQSLKIGIWGVPLSDPDTLRTRLENEKADSFNALWMVADFKLFYNESSAFAQLLEFSQSTRKPLMGASEAFVKAGALFSVSINYQTLGSQLALVARQILEDKQSPAAIGIQPPIGTFTVVNKKTGREMFGDNFNEDLFGSADKVYPEED